jgi:hypothetical protein
MFGPMVGEHDRYVYGMFCLGSVWTWWFFMLFMLVVMVRGALSLYFLAVTNGYTAAEPNDETERDSLREWREAWFDGDEKGLIFCVVAYLPQLLLWSINPGFMFYMLPCLPFMCIIVGHTIADWRDMPLGRWVMGVFITVAVCWTIAYWPLSVGYPIPKPYFEKLMLTHKWI